MEILYRGRDESMHDERFISALTEIGNVTSIFEGKLEGCSFSALEKKEFDLEILTPLTGHTHLNAIPEPSKKLGISMAFDLNEEIFDAKSKLQLEKTLSKLSGVIVDCNYIKRTLREIYDYKGEIWVVPYGCDFEEFLGTAAPMTPELKLIINRKWTKSHGNEVILQAIDLIKDRVQISAKFIGEGAEFSRLRKRFKNLEKLGIVSYLPNLSKLEMISEFRNNWIYVSASKSDGTSVSLLEAMSAGMICVTSNFASNTEWIEDGISGFTFFNNSPESLAETLLNISAITPISHSKIRDSAMKKARDDGDWRQNKVLFQRAILNSLMSCA